MVVCTGCRKEITNSELVVGVCKSCWSIINDLEYDPFVITTNLMYTANKLQKDSDKYHALTICGVDNWSGYSDAIRYLENGEEDD